MESIGNCVPKSPELDPKCICRSINPQKCLLSKSSAWEPHFQDIHNQFKLKWDTEDVIKGIWKHISKEQGKGEVRKEWRSTVTCSGFLASSWCSPSASHPPSIPIVSRVLTITQGLIASKEKMEHRMAPDLLRASKQAQNCTHILWRLQKDKIRDPSCSNVRQKLFPKGVRKYVCGKYFFCQSGSSRETKFNS